MAAQPTARASGTLDRRRLLRVSLVVGVLVVVAIVVMVRFVTGPTIREVPIAGNEDAPAQSLDALDPTARTDLAAAVEATRAEGTAWATFRRVDGDRILQTGVGRVDLAADRAHVGVAGARRLFDGGDVYGSNEEGEAWVALTVEEAAVDGFPMPGGVDPGTQLARVAEAEAVVDEGTAEVRAGALSLRTYELARLTGRVPDPGSPGERIPVEVWVDADQRIWRVAYDLTGHDRSAAVGDVDALVLDLRDFGTRVAIDPPDGDPPD